MAPNVFSQEKASGAFVHLTQIEQPPHSATCPERSAVCMAATVEDFILKKLTSVGPLSQDASGITDLTVRVIVNTSGKVSWASVKGIPEAAAEKLSEVLKHMPAFIPGEHERRNSECNWRFQDPTLYFRNGSSCCFCG